MSEFDKQDSAGTVFYHDMTLRDWFAAHAPEPTEFWIDTQRSMDRARNPHNDHYKPKLRTDFEIVAGWKFAYADAMLAERDK